MSKEEVKRSIEAILMVVDEPVTEVILAQVLECPVEEIEAAQGSEIGAVFIDYGDKLNPEVPKATRGRSDMNDYKGMELVYESFRVWMESTGKWGWTASQMKGEDRAKKIADADSASDSRNKGRVVDVVITLNLRGEGMDEILYNLAKHRRGRAPQLIGPLPTDFAFGRMVMMSR